MPNILAPSTGEIQKQSGAPRTRFHPSTGSSRTHRNRLAPSTGGIQYTAESLSPTESLSPEYWQFRNAIIAMPTMRFPSTGRSQTVEGTAESRSPKYGHIQNPPYCIQNHTENALPQVLTGFRNNQRTGESLSPKPHPQCFGPSTGGIQNQSMAWGNRFPPRTGGSWTHRKSVFL